MMGEMAPGNHAEVRLQVPDRRAPGQLYFTVADANATNLADFRQVIGATRARPPVDRYRQ